VSFAPNYLLTQNASATADGNAANYNTAQATLRYSVTTPAGTAQAVVTAAGGIVAAAGSEAVAHGNSTIVGLTTAQVTQTTSTKGSTVYFTPATAGTYTITVFHDGGATPDGLLGVGEAIGTSTVVIAADGLPSITFTQYGSTSDALGAAEFGKLVKISLRNGTLAANLGATEVLTLTGPTGTVFDQVSTLSGTSLSMTSVDGSNGVTQTLTSANFNSLGDAYVNVGSSVAGTSITVSAVVTGGTAAGASGSFSFASAADLTPATYAATAVPTDQTNPKALLGVLKATNTWSVKRGVATTVKVDFLAGASSLIY
jgi:hypothetical protein